MQLHALVGHAALELAAEKLGPGDVRRRQPSGIEFHDAVIDEHLGDIDLGAHVGHLETVDLEVAHGLAEDAPLADVFEGQVEGHLARSDILGGGNQPLLNEVFHQVVEAARRIAEHVGLRYPDVLEEQLRGVL